MVLVSIFMKTHNHFWAPSQRYKYVFTATYSKSDGVPLLAHAHCKRYVPRTYVYTNLRLQHYVSALRCRDKNHAGRTVLLEYRVVHLCKTHLNHFILSTAVLQVILLPFCCHSTAWSKCTLMIRVHSHAYSYPSALSLYMCILVHPMQ